MREKGFSVSDSIGVIRHHQLVILQNLLRSPLTEFELARAVAQSSGFDEEVAAGLMPQWLDELRAEGLVWSGSLTNTEDQAIVAAALTTKGRDLVM